LFPNGVEIAFPFETVGPVPTTCLRKEVADYGFVVVLCKSLGEAVKKLQKKKEGAEKKVRT
jgi:hypothetical protein